MWYAKIKCQATDVPIFEEFIFQQRIFKELFLFFPSYTAPNLLIASNEL